MNPINSKMPRAFHPLKARGVPPLQSSSVHLVGVRAEIWPNFSVHVQNIALQIKLLCCWYIMLQKFEFIVATSFLTVYSVITPVRRERCPPANSSGRTAATQATDTRERWIHTQLAETSGQFDTGIYSFHISNQLGTRLLRYHLATILIKSWLSYCVVFK